MAGGDLFSPRGAARFLGGIEGTRGVPLPRVSPRVFPAGAKRARRFASDIEGTGAVPLTRVSARVLPADAKCASRLERSERRGLLTCARTHCIASVSDVSTPRAVCQETVSP